MSSPAISHIFSPFTAPIYPSTYSFTSSSFPLSAASGPCLRLCLGGLERTAAGASRPRAPRPACRAEVGGGERARAAERGGGGEGGRTEARRQGGQHDALHGEFAAKLG
jgi:hypothetical protein